ncbi:MAG: hypothetical protein QF793_01900, partial [Candidatus Peribacteraceae bacterium]|nr:hypothetical protein [Candidatus Peribacteraceae bacterium]
MIDAQYVAGLVDDGVKYLFSKGSVNTKAEQLATLSAEVDSRLRKIVFKEGKPVDTVSGVLHLCSAFETDPKLASLSADPDIGSLVSRVREDTLQSILDEHFAQRLDALEHVQQEESDGVRLEQAIVFTLAPMLAKLRDRDTILTPTALLEKHPHFHSKVRDLLLQKDPSGADWGVVKEMLPPGITERFVVEENDADLERIRGMIQAYWYIAERLGPEHLARFLANKGIIKGGFTQALETIAPYLEKCRHVQVTPRDIPNIPPAMLEMPEDQLVIEMNMRRWAYRQLQLLQIDNKHPNARDAIFRSVQRELDDMVPHTEDADFDTTIHNEICGRVATYYTDKVFPIRAPERLEETITVKGEEHSIPSVRQAMAMHASEEPGSKILIKFPQGFGKTETFFYIKEHVGSKKMLIVTTKDMLHEFPGRLRRDRCYEEGRKPCYKPEEEPTIGIIEAGMNDTEIEKALDAEIVIVSFSMLEQERTFGDDRLALKEVVNNEEDHFLSLAREKSRMEKPRKDIDGLPAFHMWSDQLIHKVLSGQLSTEGEDDGLMNIGVLRTLYGEQYESAVEDFCLANLRSALFGSDDGMNLDELPSAEDLGECLVHDDSAWGKRFKRHFVDLQDRLQEANESIGNRLIWLLSQYKHEEAGTEDELIDHFAESLEPQSLPWANYVRTHREAFQSTARHRLRDFPEEIDGLPEFTKWREKLLQDILEGNVCVQSENLTDPDTLRLRYAEHGSENDGLNEDHETLFVEVADEVSYTYESLVRILRIRFRNDKIPGRTAAKILERFKRDVTKTKIVDKIIRHNDPERGTFDSYGVDEYQFASNAKGKTTQNVMRLAAEIPGLHEHGHTVLASATPWEGWLDDLVPAWCMLYPEKYGDVRSVGRAVSIYNPEEMQLVMMQRMLNMDEEFDWESNLDIETYDLSPDQQEVYDKERANEDLFRTEKIMRLQLACQNPSVIVGRPVESGMETKLKEMLDEDFKTCNTVFLLQDMYNQGILEPHEKKDPHGEFTLIKKLQEHYPDVEFVKITGSTTGPQRRKILDKARAAEEHPDGTKIVVLVQGGGTTMIGQNFSYCKRMHAINGFP